MNVMEFMNPPMGMPMDPMDENEIMIQGVFVEPNPKEDAALHLQVHADYMSTPQYVQFVTRFPKIKSIFSQHVQLTNRLYEMQGGEPQQQGAPKPGVSPSIQQGQRLNSSAPAMGTRNAQGPQQQFPMR
jgi:hypothetical protein